MDTYLTNIKNLEDINGNIRNFDQPNEFLTRPKNIGVFRGGPGSLGPPFDFFYIGKNYVLSNISKKKKVEKSLKGPPSKFSGYASGASIQKCQNIDK